MRKFLKFILLISLPLILVMAVNLFIDSKSYFTTRFSDELAEEINHNSISSYTESDIRFVIKRLIELNKGKYFGKIVLGSSQTIQIGLPIGKEVFNVSVSGAVLEDYENLISLIDSNSISYDTLLISANGWLFNKNHGYAHYHPYDQVFHLNSLYKIFSWEYFVVNLKPKYKIWDGNEDDFVIYPDGSMRYDVKFRNKVPDLKNNVKEALQWPFANYHTLDPDFRMRFEKLVKDVSTDHVVELLILPYHPKVYDEMIEKIPVLSEVEAYYYSLKSNSINVRGSFDPGKFNMESSDYYDPSHVNEKGLKKLFLSINLW